ncbi:MAG: type VI secretion system tip protein TssI/VgrG [Polyangiaceae bacterium]
MNPYELTIEGLAAETFTVKSLKGTEAMSEAYVFRLAVTADATQSADVERTALGRRAVMKWNVGKTVRAFYGVISHVRLGRSNDAKRIEYRMEFVPRLWLLKHKRRTRIFQDMRVTDVVAKVLLEEGIAVRWQLAHDYPPRPYCTQYEETDYDFVQRLLAEAGIFFYFPQGGVVDDAFLLMSTVAGVAGRIGAGVASAVGSLPGASAAADVAASIGSVASAVSPLIPGDTLICADDAAFYPPIGTDDAALLLATTALAVAPEVIDAVGDVAGGTPAAVHQATSAAAGAAGTLVGALTKQPAPPLRYARLLETSSSHMHRITDFELRTAVRPTSGVVRDYDPARPAMALEGTALSVAPFPETALETLAAIATQIGSAVEAATPGVAGEIGAGVARSAGVVATVVEGALGEPVPPFLEVYDHHAPFLFPEWGVVTDEAPRLLRHERRRVVVAEGRSGSPDLGAGHKFALVEHPTARLDQPYVVTTVEHRGRSHPKEAPRDGKEDKRRDRYTVYSNRFECVPALVPYLPPRPPRRSVQVMLTAVVLGSDIDVDPMGRIRVRFHWDRENKSSCWIRTMHAWGGAGWGTQFIPRAGMEVVVTFEGGDPDKPLVVGSVYNATHPSPFSLPQDKTRSGWRTQSSPGGGGYNELSFQDAAGGEQIYVRAQRDLDEVVQHDHKVHVQNDEEIQVDGNRKDIVRGSLDERVTGAVTTRIEGRERRDVQGPSDVVYAGDHTVRALGCVTTIVGKNDKRRSWTTHAEGTATLSGLDRLELRSDTEIVLAVGDSAVRITKAGIEISGPTITTTGEGGKQVLDKSGASTKTKTASFSVKGNVEGKAPKICLNSPSESEEPAPPPPTRIEVKDQDGSAVPFQRFVAKLDDGSEVSGKTDKDGKAEMELKSGGNVVFSDMTIDGEPGPSDLLPYLVRQGDHLDRIAFRFGFDADKVWNDPKNAELKQRRETPSVLHPGDIVHVPQGPRTGKPLQQGTTNTYTVRVPKTKSTFTFEDARFHNAKYAVEGFGAPVEGASDGGGKVELDVPVHVREATLKFVDLGEEFPLLFGHLDPADELSGARARLQHLRFMHWGDYTSEAELTAAVAAALGAFQAWAGLPVSGVLDAPTVAKLKQAYGS